MRISIQIPRSKYCALRKIAALHGLTAREIIAGFIDDLTDSPESAGSDERDAAGHWLRRRSNFRDNDSKIFERWDRWDRAERR